MLVTFAGLHREMRIYIFLLFFLVPFLHGMELKIFNVGQGNCIAITCENSPTLLVDGGSSKHPRDPYTQSDLRNLQLNTIANYLINSTSQREIYIVVSHGDEDHYGWIPFIAHKVLSKGLVVKILLGGKPEHYKTTFSTGWLPLRKSPKLKQEPQSFAYLLDILKQSFPDTFYYAYLCHLSYDKTAAYLPTYAHILAALSEARNKNDTSIVLKIQHGAFSALLTGDATGRITDTLTEPIESVIFLPSHHGATTDNCTSLNFLYKVRPRYIIVSAGMHKKHHHPAYETLARIIKYFQDVPQPLVLPHTITFYSNGPLSAYPLNIENENFKIIIPFLKNGFRSAITRYPLYNTTNAGTVTFRLRDGLYLERAESQDFSVTQCALKAPFIHHFSSIRSLIFQGLNLTDSSLSALTTLPPKLTYLDLRNNNLNLKGVFHLLRLLNKSTHDDRIFKLHNNPSFTNEELNSFLLTYEDLKDVTIINTFNKNVFDKTQPVCFEDVQVKTHTLARNSDDTKIISEDLLKHMRAYNIPFDIYTALFSSGAAYLPAYQCIVVATLINQQFRGYSIPIAPYSIDALCFSPNTALLACASAHYDSTLLWDKQQEKWLGAVSGCFLYDENKAAYRLGSSHYSFNSLRSLDNLSNLPLLGPFTSNSQYFITFSKKTATLYLWQLSHNQIPRAVFYKDLRELKPHYSVNDIDYATFTDNDRSLLIYYKDRSSYYMPLLLDDVLYLCKK